MVGAVVLLCCAGAAIGGALIGEEEPASPAVASVVPAGTTIPPDSDPTAPAAPDRAAEIIMSDVVGQNAAVAADELTRLGFIKVEFGSQDAEDKVVILPSNWTVTKQSTKAGTRVAPDTLIVLTCTKQT